MFWICHKSVEFLAIRARSGDGNGFAARGALLRVAGEFADNVAPKLAVDVQALIENGFECIC